MLGPKKKPVAVHVAPRAPAPPPRKVVPLHVAPHPSATAASLKSFIAAARADVPGMIASGQAAVVPPKKSIRFGFGGGSGGAPAASTPDAGASAAVAPTPDAGPGMPRAAPAIQTSYAQDTSVPYSPSLGGANGSPSAPSQQGNYGGGGGGGGGYQPGTSPSDYYQSDYTGRDVYDENRPSYDGQYPIDNEADMHSYIEGHLPEEGMSTAAKVGIGAAVVAGLYFLFGRKKRG